MTSVSDSVRKTRPQRAQLLAKLQVVVQLAVIDEREASIGVQERLVARGEIDDREPPMAENDDVVRRIVRSRPGRGAQGCRSSRKPWPHRKDAGQTVRNNPAMPHMCRPPFARRSPEVVRGPFGRKAAQRDRAVLESHPTQQSRILHERDEHGRELICVQRIARASR